MKPYYLLVTTALALAACAAPVDNSIPSNADAPVTVSGHLSEEAEVEVEKVSAPETPRVPEGPVEEIEDIEPADGIVAGEEEIEIANIPDAPTEPGAPHEMAGIPPLTAENYNLTSVATLELEGSESPEKIGRMLRKRFGQAEGEGDYDQELEVFEDGANALVVFTTDGLADDSVKAAQHVVQIFFPAAVPAGVTGYGVRYKCYRGADAEAWVNTLCP